jgi:peptidoglycan/xylan/chitin deacetylase (PgdA/CDA1 family)
MNPKVFLCYAGIAVVFAACDHSASFRTAAAAKISGAGIPDSAALISKEIIPANRILANASTILSRKQVPILCYHQLRDWKSTDSKRAKDYIVPVSIFRGQMKMLADSGYTTILPDQLMNYLKFGDPLPDKPVMLSFDDTDLDQFELAKPVMDQYHFKGVFFVMTVSLNKPRYMSREQVKQLSDEGHVIGSHTWDHMNVRKFETEDWAIQVDKPLKQLEEITGKPVKYFAYPFGLWKPEVIPGLKERHFEGAFQLSAKMDEKDPLYAIRRIIVPGEWTAETMYKVMLRSFR